MKIQSSAISLTVDHVPASSHFLQSHFRFEEQWSADGFAYMRHPSAGMDIVFLRVGLEVLPQSMNHQKAEGVIVAFIIDDIEAEEQRLRNEGVTITLPIQEDPWGERLFQVTDPNGVVFQVVQWVQASDEQYADNPGSSMS